MASWAIAERSCLISLFSASPQRQSSLTPLTVFPWLAYLIIGIATGKTILRAMGQVAEQSRSSKIFPLAKQSYRLALELEEVYGLDITWPSYVELYARLRKELGVDDQRTLILERAQLLTQHVAAQADRRRQHSIYLLQVTGLIGGAVVIILQLHQDFPHLNEAGIYWVITAVIVCMIAGVLILRSPFRIEDWRRWLWRASRLTARIGRRWRAAFRRSGRPDGRSVRPDASESGGSAGPETVQPGGSAGPETVQPDGSAGPETVQGAT